MPDGPRQRLLTAAMELMCERGVHGTALTDLLDLSGTARGSVYQHFPDGKSQLMTEATRVAGRWLGAMLDDLLATRAPADALTGMVDYWRETLVGSDFQRGCPVLAAAQAGPGSPRSWLRQPTRSRAGPHRSPQPSAPSHRARPPRTLLRSRASP
ncbi:TetR/AcrR family transcriptional regulator [Tsukamurella soli]|uniref:TetR/AcrR family transcriptional regulator n=1 Tax=Tsukamurella soli TaxID=644556 RepID=UPI00360B1F25